MKTYYDLILDFLSKYRDKGEDFYTTKDIIEAYKGCLEYFEDCYQGILAEYDNDIWIREVIEDTLTNELFKGYSEHENFIAEVARIDEKFKQITIEINNIHSKYWWENRVLKKAGPLYAEDVKIFFGKEIEICNN